MLSIVGSMGNDDYGTPPFNVEQLVSLHGKTTLTAAITRMLAEEGKAKVVALDEIDKAPKEKKRIWRGTSALAEHMRWKIAARRNQTVIWVKPLTGDCCIKKGTLVLNLHSTDLMMDRMLCGVHL